MRLKDLGLERSALGLNRSFFMAAVVDKEKCEACSDCVEACPNGSIAIVEEKAQVNKDDCIDCGACVDACTKGAIALGD